MPGFQQRNGAQSTPLVFSLQLGKAQRVEKPWHVFAHPVKVQFAGGNGNHLTLNHTEAIIKDTQNYLANPCVFDSSDQLNSCHGDINSDNIVNDIDKEVENIFQEIENLGAQHLLVDKDIKNLDSDHLVDGDIMGEPDAKTKEELESEILYTFEEITSEENQNLESNQESTSYLKDDFKPLRKLFPTDGLLDNLMSDKNNEGDDKKQMGKNSGGDNEIPSENSTSKHDNVCDQTSAIQTQCSDKLQISVNPLNDVPVELKNEKSVPNTKSKGKQVKQKGGSAKLTSYLKGLAKKHKPGHSSETIRAESSVIEQKAAIDTTHKVEIIDSSIDTMNCDTNENKLESYGQTSEMSDSPGVTEDDLCEEYTDSNTQTQTASIVRGETLGEKLADTEKHDDLENTQHKVGSKNNIDLQLDAENNREVSESQFKTEDKSHKKNKLSDGTKKLESFFKSLKSNQKVTKEKSRNVKTTSSSEDKSDVVANSNCDNINSQKDDKMESDKDVPLIKDNSNIEKDVSVIMDNLENEKTDIFDEVNFVQIENISAPISMDGSEFENINESVLETSTALIDCEDNYKSSSSLVFEVTPDNNDKNMNSGYVDNDSDSQSLVSPRYDAEQSPGSLISDSGFLSQCSFSEDKNVYEPVSQEPSKTQISESDSELLTSDYVILNSTSNMVEVSEPVSEKMNDFDDLFEVNPSIIDECLDVQENYYESTPLCEQSILEEDEGLIDMSPENSGAWCNVYSNNTRRSTDSESELSTKNLSNPESVSQNEEFPENILDNEGLPENILDIEKLPENTLENKGLPENTLENKGLPENILDYEGLPENVSKNTELPENVFKNEHLENEENINNEEFTTLEQNAQLLDFSAPATDDLFENIEIDDVTNKSVKEEKLGSFENLPVYTSEEIFDPVSEMSNENVETEDLKTIGAGYSQEPEMSLLDDRPIVDETVNESVDKDVSIDLTMEHTGEETLSVTILEVPQNTDEKCDNVSGSDIFGVTSERDFPTVHDDQNPANDSEVAEPTENEAQHVEEDHVHEVPAPNSDIEESTDLEEIQRKNMEFMETLQANAATLLNIQDNDDADNDIENENMGEADVHVEIDDEVELTMEESDNKEITSEGSENQPKVLEINSSKPSSLPHYARNTETLDTFENSSTKPSSLPHYARNNDTLEVLENSSTKPSSLPHYARNTNTLEPFENSAAKPSSLPHYARNKDTPQNKVSKCKHDDENVSYSEFDEDLKIEPISNIKKMFESEGSLVYPVPSPERKIKTNVSVKSSATNFNTLSSDDLKNQDDSEMEIISGATPVEDVTLPSVSVRNMLKMWEENKTTEDRGPVDKPFNRLSKKWHSCGHIYFKVGDQSDSLTDGSVKEYVDVEATQPGRYDSDSNRQRENKRVLYKSSSYISLTPSTNNSTPSSNDNIASSNSHENFDISDSVTKDTKTQVQDGGRTITTTTTKTVTESKGDPKGGSSSMKIKQETSTVTSPKSTSVQQNGVDSRITTTQTTREEVRQTEISKNMANMAAPAAAFDDDDDDDEGVYENVPSAPRTDVYRETDAKVDVELPQSGRASNMRERFLKLAGESAAGARTADRELTPPPTVKGKVEAGVFESQPSPKRTDVYRQETRQEVVLPEKGKALNTVQKYKEIASREFKGPANKREITPDRSGVVEYVSEPRAEHMTYEEKPLEAGIFESKPNVIENVSRYEDYVPDARPQSGTAKSIASKYKEIERNAALPQPASNRREITPDRSGPNEFVSEPRGQHITYEEKVEAGIYENEPAPVRQDIYRHEEYYVEEPLPEKGYAKNLAARFREIEQKAAIPKASGHRVSPPKDDNRNVFENEPAASPVAYKEAVVQPDVVPEKGLAKNLASRYKKIEEENLKARAGNRQVKEFTPPKDERTVFESAPTPSRLHYEEVVPESGILESQPTVREDVYRYTDPKDIEVELPERGAAKNLLSRWKQIESESAKGSPPTPGRVKEFTPPREEERIKQLRSPKTPPSGQNNSVHPNDLPGQYHPINEPTVFESKPAPQREDLFREADTDWTVGLPKANKTKKVLAKFQAIQAQTTSSSPVSRKAHDDMEIPTPVRENKPKKVGHFVAVQNEKCGACQKTVYAMEKVEMNKNAYHRACFKCSQCRAVLTPKTFAINAGTMFCTSHYKQLFARKGNYDEGFGRPQHKKKWKSESNLLDGELHEMEHEIEA